MGQYRPASTTTFATYATAWIEVAALKEQTRCRYRSILRRDLLPVFGGYRLVKIHPDLGRRAGRRAAVGQSTCTATSSPAA